MSLVSYLNDNPKNQLIFDFDNTIVRLLISWDRWYEEIENELYKIDKELVEMGKNGQLNLSDFQNSFVKKYGKSIKNKIIAHNRDFEKNFLKGYKINQELIEEIKILFGKKYLWTSNTRQTVIPILNEIGILALFEKIITRDDVTFVKPNIDGFAFIYDPEIPKNEYLLIGDSGSDEKASQKAEINFYKITYFGDFANL